MKLMVLLVLIFSSIYLFGANNNLLNNPGFEDFEVTINRPAHWTLSPTESIGGRTTLCASEGGASGYILKNKKSTYVSLAQKVKVKPNTRYRLSAKLMGRGKLFAYELDQNNKHLSNTHGVFAYWNYFKENSLTFTTSNKTMYCSVRFELYGKNEIGEGCIDDVVLQECPSFPEKRGIMTAKQSPSGHVILAWPDVIKDKENYAYAISWSRYPEYSSAGNAIVSKDVTFDHTPATDWSTISYFVSLVYLPSGESSDWQWCATIENQEKSPNSHQMQLNALHLMNRHRRYMDPAAPAQVLSFDFRMAANEYETKVLSVFANGRALHNLNVSVQPFADSKLQRMLRVNLLRMEYVPISGATLPNCPDGLIADPVVPWNQPLLVPASATQGILLQIRTDKACPAGKYKTVLTVSAEGINPVEIPVYIQVESFILPTTPSYQSAFAIWPKALSLQYNVEYNSPEMYKIWKKYYSFLLDYRLCGGSLPVPDFISKETLDYLKDKRINTFALPLPYQAVNSARNKDIASFLKKHNLLSKSYVYLDDEPEPAKYSRCTKLLEEMRLSAPGIRTMIAFNRDPAAVFDGKLDIWCPHIKLANDPHLRKRQKAGDAIWWYTCGIYPQVPNYTIDESGLNIRLLSWLQFLYGIDGVLYWQTVAWNHNSINNAYPFVPASPGKKYHGDGYLMYPGELFGHQGPVASLRLEQLRDGNEDYEYLSLLRNRLYSQSQDMADAEAMSMVLPLARNLADRTDSPELLLRQRNRIMDMILQLQP